MFNNCATERHPPLPGCFVLLWRDRKEDRFSRKAWESAPLIRSPFEGSGESKGFPDEEEGVADDAQAAEKHGRDGDERIQKTRHGDGDSDDVVEA